MESLKLLTQFWSLMWDIIKNSDEMVLPIVLALRQEKQKLEDKYNKAIQVVKQYEEQ